MNPQLIMAAILAAAGFVGGWTIQSWRYGAKENERAQQELVDERSAATTAIRRQESVIAATSAATARETTLRRDADGSRRALVSLSDATDQTLRDASTSLGACTERAAALGELFTTSAEQYRNVAEKADRHASDVKTCHDAWPK